MAGIGHQPRSVSSGFSVRSAQSGSQTNSVDISDFCLNAEDVQVHNQHSDDEQSQVILSVIWYANNLGAACYDVDTCQMRLMVDYVDSAPTFHLLHLLIKEVEPVFIVTSCRTDERVINVLNEDTSRSTTSDSRKNNAMSDSTESEERFIHLLPSLDFAYETSKHRLQNIDLPNLPKSMNESERRIYMSTLINFTNTCMIKAAGGLLKFLEKKRIGVQLEDENVHSPVSSISLFSLKNIVAVDDCTYSALQIFQEKWHPSVSRCDLGMKEDLSLFGICNRCKSTIGTKELRRWFLQPTKDLQLILLRQTAIKHFTSVKNIEVTNSLQSCLKHIKNISGILSRMRTAQASINDWRGIYKTAYNAMLIGNLCRSQPSSIEIFKKIKQAFTSDLFRIASLINKIVDFDESLTQNHFVVKPGVDEQLDHMKRTYNGLPDFMTKVAHQELQHLSEDVQECSVIYLPQLGYLLAIPQTEAMKTTKNYSFENLEFMFISNNVVYYKSSSTRELDRLLGDTKCEITDQETQIMHRLQNAILEISQVLVDVMKYSAELDCLISLAVVAKEFNYVQPEITTDGCINIIKGRHPLQELCVASFVPNNTQSGGTASKVKVITGPNASGKSIYLKQVALIVFMAHIGSFVPVETAKITLVDHIFSRMQTIESVSINLSTFLIELNQISNALRNATEKSLVVVDEYGKGTDTKGGLALLASSLCFWLKKGPKCPHLFLSTHFHSLCHLLPDSAILKYQTLEVLNNEEELVFLYQLIDGRADSSFGRYAALQAGIPKEIVARGMKVSELQRQGRRISPCGGTQTVELYQRLSAIAETFLRLDLVKFNVLEFLGDCVDVVKSPTISSASASTVTGSSRKESSQF